MRLKKGATAPNFATKDMFGSPIELGDYSGRWLLLSFFRFAKCPYRNVRVSRMASRCAAFRDAGLEMVAVFESPNDSMLEGVGEQRPPFPLIADPDNELYDRYGVEIRSSGC